MLTIMIAEDDMLTRIGLVSMLKGNCQYDVVAEADNGRTALEIAGRLQPDVIITDVQMPLLNGIELIRAAKQAGIAAKFIILSAYADYEYVREGILLGAEDYLLKLDLEKNRLFSLLDGIAQKIEKGKTAAGERPLPDPTDDRAMERCVYNLVTARFPDRQAASEALNACGLDLPEKDLICILASPEMGAAPNTFDLYSASRVLRMLTELLKNYGQGCGCLMDTNLFCLVFSLREELRIPRGSAFSEKICGDLANYVKNALNIRLRVLASEKLDEYRQLPAFFTENCSIENSHYYLSRSQDGSENADLIFSMELNLLDSVLKNNDREEIKRSFDLLLASIRNAGEVSGKSLHSVCYFLIYIIDSYFKSLPGPHADWSRSDVLLTLNQSCRKLEDYLRFIGTLQDLLIAFIESSCTRSTAVKNAEAYIRKHYARDLPLDEVALHVGLTPSYFCRLFAQSTGNSFVNFLKGIRIAQAKKLLLTTNEKIQTIGNRVGYNNTYYFCRVFKKETGMSPQHFRKSQDPAGR